MKSKLKIIAVSFILMILIDFIINSLAVWELGIENPHVGLLFVIGLIFGPYGALGATLANVVLDLNAGFDIIEILPSAIITFGVSYLAYKLWYSGFRTKKITKPRLDNIDHLILFLSSIIMCGFVYSAVHGNLIGIYYGELVDEFYLISYFLNFVNLAFIFGIISIWLSKKYDFIQTPKKSQRSVNNRLYRIIFIFLLIVSLISVISLILDLDSNIITVEIILIGIFLFAYLTKPYEYDVQPHDENTVTEQIIRNFLIITLTISIVGIIISILSYNVITQIRDINIYFYLMPTLVITDLILILFFIPGILILKYIEQKVLKPISSFSEIESFIRENEKIEAEGLLNIYSDYIYEQNEIGTLARSYTDLINHNNNYIENIHEIEGEKERINAELDIATNIQAAALPTESIENDDFLVNGYSHPAKEVGGDFFDYYMIDDENLAIVIGDASGKGVPAALIAMITQVIIKQMLKYDKDPSKVLYLLNNQLAENNPQSMFLTLWLGIYNKNTKKLTFSNAGHNPPLIKENGIYEHEDIETGIVLGIMEDFEYVLEEIELDEELVLYTDGITDANNNEEKMYGEDRLLNFFNGFNRDEDPIMPLLDDIHNFTEDAEQYDDMTLLYLRIK